MTTLVRLLARPMLAAGFVLHGARALKDPDPLVPQAKPVTDRIVPVLKQYAPPQLVGRIPENPRTLVRINGLVQVLGGLALATNKYRRLGAFALLVSLVPTTMAAYAFWEEQDKAERERLKDNFIKNVGLGGGLLLAAVDTEGKPGLLWRMGHGAAEVAEGSRRAIKSAKREAKQAAKAARREAKLAALQAKTSCTILPISHTYPRCDARRAGCHHGCPHARGHEYSWPSNDHGGPAMRRSSRVSPYLRPLCRGGATLPSRQDRPRRRRASGTAGSSSRRLAAPRCSSASGSVRSRAAAARRSTARR
jgi:putative oxidoreductase